MQNRLPRRGDIIRLRVTPMRHITTLTSMASSVVTPQDIIDSIIAVVDDDDDHRLLKICALVSSSFLLPSRKRIFSSISLRTVQDSQRLHQFLVANPVVLSSVKNIAIHYGWRLKASPLSILHLPFCCLKSFSIRNSYWNDFSSELKDAISNIIHSPTLKPSTFSDLAVCQLRSSRAST